MNNKLGPIPSSVMFDGDVNNITISGTTAYYSKHFDLFRGSDFALSYDISSSTGTGEVKVELEQSHYEPDVPYAADANYKVPEGMGTLDSATGNSDYYVPFEPAAIRYGRLKITGQGSNPNDTVFKGKWNIVY